MKTSLLDSVETVRTGLQRGRIDQQLFYQSPDAAMIWLAMADSPQYRSYDHCVDSLGTLIGRDAWVSVLGGGKHDTIVMLGGGGSPSKDWLLIEQFTSRYPDRTLRFCILDSSPYLLRESARFLQTKLKRSKPAKNVRLSLLWWNFMGLETYGPISTGSNNVVWAITGGTIGNVDELGFFRSLNTRAQRGDRLIVSADTIGGDDDESVRERLIEKYQHEDMKRFLRGVMEAIRLEVGASVSEEEDLALKIDVVDGVAAGHTKLESARSVEFVVSIGGKRVVLLSSTRYDADELIRFARRKNWHVEDVATGSRDPNYRQFLFRYEPTN